MQAANWFVGLRLPEPSGWIEVAAGLPSGVRRFHPSDLHITVAFLGACEEEHALRAWQALEPRRHPPIPVSAARWLALGPPSAPSAFGLGLANGHQAVAALMASWGAEALAAAGRAPDRREPLPHVTLARPTRRGGDGARTAMQQWITTAPVPEQPTTLEQLALFTWAANREERLFQVVAERRLDQSEWLRQLEAEV